MVIRIKSDSVDWKQKIGIANTSKKPSSNPFSGLGFSSLSTTAVPTIDALGRALWSVLMFFNYFLSDPSPIIVYPCHWLTHCCLVNFIDVTLACEDANSKLVDAVTVADDDGVGNNLLQIWNLRFRQKAKLLFRLWAQGLVKIWSWSSGKIWCWSLVSFLLLMFCKGNVESKLNLGRDCEARFGQDFEL